MKSPHTVVLVAGAFVVATVLMAASSGCAVFTEQERAGDPEQLRHEARDFHSNLRWERYEHAADAVHPAWRNTFEGKYEQRGEDFEIVDMRMKGIELVEEGQVAVVQVDQEWFELPSTVVEDERFVERWVWEGGRWWLRERLRQEEYRDRDETFDSELTGGSDESSHPDESAGQ